MSYYENRIKALEERVAEMSMMQRMKAIPVEAKLVDRIAKLLAENERLRKAGDAMAIEWVEREGLYHANEDFIAAWNYAKEGKPTK